MTIQSGKNFYKIATKSELPWLESEVAVFKRSGPFNWELVDIQIDSVEDAQEYIKYAPILEVA